MKKKLITSILTLAAGLAITNTALADEPYCREFTQDVTIGGKVKKSYGTACMQPNGAWKIISGDVSFDEPVKTKVKHARRAENVYVVPSRVIVVPVPAYRPYAIRAKYKNRHNHHNHHWKY